MMIRRATPGGLIYEVDFSAEASIADFGNGAVTIDGMTWYSWNNGGANKCQLVNGSGVRLYGNGSSGNNHSSAWFGMDLSQIMDNAYGMDIDLWAEVSYSGTITSWNSYAGREMGIGMVPLADPSGGDTMPFAMPHAGWNEQVTNGGIRLRSELGYNTGTSQSIDFANENTTPDIWMLRCRGKAVGFYRTAAVSGWPQISAMTKLGSLINDAGREHSVVSWGPVFRAFIDNDEYLQIERMRMVHG